MSVRMRALVAVLAVLGCVGSACGGGSEQAMRVRGGVYAAALVSDDARSSRLIVLDAGVLTVMPSPQPELAEQVLWMDERVVALSSSSVECPIAVVDPAGSDPYCVVPDLTLDSFGAWSGVTVCGQGLLLALPSPRDPTVVYSVSLAEAGLQAAAQKWTVDGLVEAGACDGRVVVGPFSASGDTVVERLPAEQHSNSSAPSLSSAPMRLAAGRSGFRRARDPGRVET